MQSGQDHVGGGVQLVEPEKPFVITALVDGRPRCWRYGCYSIAMMVVECLLRTGTVPASHEVVTNVTFSDRRRISDNIDTHDRRLERAYAAIDEIIRITEQTHQGQERAYTSLSLIQQKAREVRS